MLFKKIWKSTALLTLILAIGIAAAKPAQAMLITGGDDLFGGRMEMDGGDAFLCLLILPLCLLDAHSDGSNAVTSADLVVNGYSAAQIQNILRDQTALQNNLVASKQKMSISKDDTRASISKDLHSVLPSVSDDYVNFFTDSAALK